jgi:hypothetical protein
MSDELTDETEHVTDGDLLEAEADALVEIFNSAAPDYSPDLEWFGMSPDHETETQQFVLEAEGYIDPDGLAALRDCGRTIDYIEGYEYDGEVQIQIQLPARGETPGKYDTGTEQEESA